MRPLLLLALPSLASAATLSVGPGQPYATPAAALDDAADGDRIEIAAGTYPGALRIEDLDVTVAGLGVTILTAQDDSVVRIEGGTVVLEDLTIRPNGGRGVRVDDAADATLREVVIEGNQTGRQAYNGAAAALFSGSLILEACTLRDNTSTPDSDPRISSGFGGHLYVVDGDLTVQGGTIVRGTGEEGGAAWLGGEGTATFEDVVIRANRGVSAGGALFLTDERDLVLTRVRLESNTTAGNGGALRWEEADGDVTLVASSLTDNQADGYGGGIATNGGGVISFDTVGSARNAAGIGGGALSAFDLDGLTIRGSGFCGESAADEGGALRVQDVGTVDVRNSVLMDSASGGDGGGLLWLEGTGPVVLRNNHLIDGATGGPGGGVWADVDDLELRNNLIAWTASGSGVVLEGGGTWSYNAYHLNTPDDLGGEALGPGAVSGWPGLYQYRRNGLCGDDRLEPKRTSRLVDAGDPALLDPDGTPSDIGAFGGPDADPALFTDGDGDGALAVYDCDDADPAVFPGATEACNGVDDDCNGIVDDPGATGSTTVWRDDDGDGFGDPGAPLDACVRPDDHVENDDDCDDADPTVFPGATELCDGRDGDCDGDVDSPAPADAATVWFDGDGDGFGDSARASQACDPPPGFAEQEGDCDDDDPDRNPGADERCDGLDQDCDDAIDEDPVDAPTWYRDVDGDGFGGAGAEARVACEQPDGFRRDDRDCDDADPAIFPGAPESCDPPLVDANCDGFTGSGDADGDGYPACDDCDDGEPLAFPGAPEIWYDGVQFDCTSESDFDADRDGFEAAAYGGTDCDDADPEVSPVAREIPGNAVDEDCDGVAVEAAEAEALRAACGGCRTGGAGPGWLLLPLLAGLRRRRPTPT